MSTHLKTWARFICDGNPSVLTARNSSLVLRVERGIGLLMCTLPRAVLKQRFDVLRIGIAHQRRADPHSAVSLSSRSPRYLRVRRAAAFPDVRRGFERPSAPR